MTPSTTWKENVAADEETRFAAYAEVLGRMQAARAEKYGKGRALHRKQVLGLTGELEILPDLPAHARHGLFANAKKHAVWIRLSNGGPEIQRDKKPDVRGFSLKVLGVEGPGALGIPTTSQDFLMINRRSFGLPDPDTFMGVIQAFAKGPIAVAGYLIGRRGLIDGVRTLARLDKSQKQPFSGFATEAFFTAAPIACGPYAIRARIVPELKTGVGNGDDLAQDIEAQLALGPIHFGLEAQFYTDEAKTPIENAEPDWLEADSPYLKVGRLTIPQQALHDDAAKKLAAEIEATKFDPWSALVEHRPLGAVMRARKVAYYKSQQGRSAV